MVGRRTELVTAWLKVSAGCMILFAGTHLQAQAADVETAPAFESPDLSPSLLDFITGMPVAKTMKEMVTPKLLREPFAGAPVDTPKGLAAKIKAKQVDEKNRVAAVAFLGTVDCVVYPESQEMLVKSMQEDSSEKVRLAAVKALQDQFGSGRTKRNLRGKFSKKEERRYDTCRGCCNEKTLNALAERAYETDETGCPLEPSERVREAARKALETCVACCHCQSTEPSVPPMPAEEATEESREENYEGDKPREPKPVPVPVPKVPAPPSENPNSAAARQLTPVQKALIALYTRRGMRVPKSIVPDTPSQAAKTAEVPAASADESSETQIVRTAVVEEATENKADETNETQITPIAAVTEKPVPAVDEATENQADETNETQITPIAAVTEKPAPVVACLRGHCPVAMQNRQVVKASAEFVTRYDGHTYFFASDEARREFLANPEKYAPVNSGYDVVIEQKTGEREAGDYVSEYEGRQYWFKTLANKKEFLQDSAKYVK